MGPSQPAMFDLLLLSSWMFWGWHKPWAMHKSGVCHVITTQINYKQSEIIVTMHWVVHRSDSQLTTQETRCVSVQIRKLVFIYRHILGVPIYIYIYIYIYIIKKTKTKITDVDQLVLKYPMLICWYFSGIEVWCGLQSRFISLHLLVNPSILLPFTTLLSYVWMVRFPRSIQWEQGTHGLTHAMILNLG